MRVILLICLIFSQIVMAEDQVKDAEVANTKTYKDGNEKTEDMECMTVTRRINSVDKKVVYCHDKNSPEWKELSRSEMDESQTVNYEELDKQEFERKILSKQCKVMERMVTPSEGSRDWNRVLYCHDGNSPEWKIYKVKPEK